MKKRVKLLTTIASLCLAVALMAFGVYAATSASFSITNKVSFTATPNVKATVTLEVTEWENITEAKPTAGTDNWTQTIVSENSDAEVGADWTIAGDAEGFLALTPKTVAQGDTMVITYTVTIVNDALSTDSNKWLYVDLTAVPVFTAVEAPHQHSFTAENGGEAVGTDLLATGKYIAVAQGKTLVFTVSLTVNVAKDLPETNLSLAFTLSAGQNQTKA